MRYLIHLFFLMSILPAKAQESSFSTYMNWSQHLQEAKGQGKKIILFFYSSTCGPCKELERNFHDPAVMSILKDSFLLYSMDLNSEKALPFSKKYRITTVPTILVINKNGWLIERTEGSWRYISDFKEWLAAANQSKTIYKGISNSLDMNYPAFYNDFFNNRMKRFPDSVVVDNYLKSQNDLSTEVNWDVLSLFNQNEVYYDTLIRDREKFKERYGMEVTFKILDMYRRIAQQYTDRRDSAGFNKLTLQMIAPRGPLDTGGWQSYDLRAIKFLGETGMDWPKFYQKVHLFNQKYGGSENQTICQYSYERSSKAVSAYLLRLLDSAAITEPYNLADLYYMRGVLLLRMGKAKEANASFHQSIFHCEAGVRRKNYKGMINEAKQKYTSTI